jgi:hypothetical protein
LCFNWISKDEKKVLFIVFLIGIRQSLGGAASSWNRPMGLFIFDAVLEEKMWLLLTGYWRLGSNSA